MAIKPAINPGVAVADKTATKAGAVNFLGGGTPLGASVVSSAANKIVGFQRGASAVAPKPPDLGSIIQTLSSNILSNVQNSFESANKNIQQFITNNFAERLGEFRGKVEEVTSNPPSKILQNFLSLYRQAIDYIRFLGDRRNIKRLGDNLKALQDVFSESFQVATIIRKTINKIVKQLSNLPKSNSGPGGLNLDIKVPGGPLRKSMPSKRNMMKMGLMGAGLVGAGALGSQVVSGMMDAGGEKIEPTSTDFSGMIPASVMDQFSQILDRFDKAIQSLTKGSQQTPGSAGVPSGGGAESTGGGGGDDGGGGGSPTTGSGTPADVSGNYTAAEKALIATVTQSEGTPGDTGYNKVYGGAIVPQLTEMTLDELYEASRLGGTDRLPDRLGGGRIPYYKDKHNSSASGAPQLMPGTLRGLLDSGKFSGDQKFSKEVQNAIIIELAKRRMGGKPITPQNVRKYMPELGKEWASMSPYHKQSTTTVGESISLFDKNLRHFESQPATSAAPAIGGPIEPIVTPDTSRSQVQRVAAQSVSQVPPQQAPEIQIIPLDMGNTQNVNQAISQATGSGSPVMSNGGVTVPFLSSSNDDNSYTMFTKTVYNILD